MKSWICSICGAERYFGILHKCKESEVKIDPTLRDVRVCDECGRKLSDDYLRFCPRCQPEPESPCIGKPYPPTHSVELTEGEVKWLEDALDRSYETSCNILAKLRPKKESVEFVEFWVDERFKARIYSDVVGLYERCESQIGEKDATFMYKQIPRNTLEKLYAAYEARKGEVK